MCSSGGPIVAYLTTLSETELMRFEKQYSCLPSFFAVIDTVPVDCLMSLCSALFSGSDSYMTVSRWLHQRSKGVTNPEVNIHMSSSADLISYGHLEHCSACETASRCVVSTNLVVRV